MNSVFEKERFMLVFALVIVVSILIIVGLLVFFPIPSENKDTLIQVIGTSPEPLSRSWASSSGARSRVQIRRR